MKNLVLLISFLLVTISVQSQTVDNKSIYNVDAFITKSLEYLNITDTTVVVHVLPTYKYQPKDGLVYDSSRPNHFLVYISESNVFSEYLLILGHELIHVEQIHTGKLVPTNGVSTFSYTYDKFLQYDKAFEDDANERGIILKGLFYKVR